MQKSFVASLALSFILAFSVVAYLSSPFTLNVQTIRAEADEISQDLPEVPDTADVSMAPSIPFSALNIISLIEVSNDLAFATSTNDVELAELSVEAQTKPATRAPAPVAAKKVTHQTSHPVRLIIPSIGLNAPIESVGINAVGEMDVPNGNTPNVGWYKKGPIPGNIGSAVIDAHVYAAFKNLRNLSVGSEVFVENTNGERLKFVVDDSRVYQLGELTSGQLFGRRDARRLNLITCAGQVSPDGSTYTHRLVVYTTLAA